MTSRYPKHQDAWSVSTFWNCLNVDKREISCHPGAAADLALCTYLLRRHLLLLAICECDMDEALARAVVRALVAEVGVVEVGVVAAAGEQRVVRALLHDAPMIEDEDAVNVLDR